MLLVVVLILHKEMLVRAVTGEQDGRCAQTRKGAAESVESGEGALEAPGVGSLPGVVSRLASGLLEGSHVEAGDVGLCATGSGLQRSVENGSDLAIRIRGRAAGKWRATQEIPLLGFTYEVDIPCRKHYDGNWTVRIAFLGLKRRR